MAENPGPERHRTLARQMRRSMGSDGLINVETLLSLIETTYAEHDQAREIDSRAMTLAAEELTVLNETLSAARDAADAANTAKSQFLSSLSHEIRTPLNGVLGTAAALIRTDLASDQRRMVQIMLDSGRVLTTLLNDVLDLAKIESGRMDLEATPMALAATLQAAVDLFRCTAAEKGIDLSLEVVGEASAWVVGDATRLQQVLQNLLSNAIKFTPSGGVRVVADIGACGERVSLSLEVHDSGIGISEDARSRLFQRFSQADSGITRRFGGTGLGLALCRDLVTAMGGRIGMRSGEPCGSVFSIDIAFDRVSAPLPTSVDLSPGSSLERAIRVLVADDNATNRFVLQTLLGSFGFDVVAVEDGAKAVAVAAEAEFDVILMDIHMPVLDGVAATRAIRRLPGSSASAPIVAVTAGVSELEMKTAREAGIGFQLAKPIQPDALMAVIRQALSEPQADPGRTAELMQAGTTR